MPINTTKTIHKTGLRLVTHCTPDSPAVSLNIFVHTGSRYENADNAGVAHFFEHMVFKGTTKRPTSYQISYELESIGAEVNAATSHEYTVYYIKVLKSNAEKGFEILTDAFLHSLIDKDEVDKERGVIKEEIKMYEDDPSSFADDELMENLYPHDQYGRNIAGTVKHLDEIDAEKIKNFVKNNYFYENTVIVASGNIQMEELESLIDKYFDEYQHGEDREVPFETDHFETDLKIYNKEIQQAQLRLATYSVSFNDDDKYKIGVAMDVLGSGMGSKLFIEVREKLGLAYNIYAYNKHWSKSGYIVIGAGLMPENIELAQKVCLEEMKKLGEGEFTIEDLNRAKELSKSSLLMNMDTIESWAWFLGKREIMYKELTTIEKIIAAVDAVTMDDVKNVMKELSEQKWHSTVVTNKI